MKINLFFFVATFIFVNTTSAQNTTVDGAKRYQVIHDLGVNINPQSWNVNSQADKNVLDSLITGMLTLADTTVTYGVGAYNAPFYRYEPIDTKGNKLNAHMPDILKDGGFYHWFGEAPRYRNQTYGGVNCYRSTDMKSWTFIGNVAPIQASGHYSHDVVACSHRVMYNGSQWVMISAECGPPPSYLNMHDVVAVSKNGITGPYYYTNDLNTTNLGGKEAFLKTRMVPFIGYTQGRGIEVRRQLTS